MLNFSKEQNSLQSQLKAGYGRKKKEKTIEGVFVVLEDGTKDKEKLSELSDGSADATSPWSTVIRADAAGRW